MVKKRSTHIDRPTSPAAFRLEAARARENSKLPQRSEIDRARDMKVAGAFDGLADNQTYLDKQEEKTAKKVCFAPRRSLMAEPVVFGSLRRADASFSLLRQYVL